MYCSLPVISLFLKAQFSHNHDIHWINLGVMYIVSHQLMHFAKLMFLSLASLLMCALWCEHGVQQRVAGQ